MQFTTLTVLLASVAAALAMPALEERGQTATLTYDQTYDNAKGSLNTVACSNGEHGLVDKYPTFGDLPGFPSIGGAFAVEGWDSANCGTCWNLSYAGKSINVLAVDHAGPGRFNIALKAMNTLTNGHAVELGAVQVTYKQVDASKCH